MAGFVLDASFALAIAMPDDVVASHLELSDRIAQQGAIVPILWRMEIANAMAMSVRRGRLVRAQVAVLIDGLDALGIEIDHLAVSMAFTTLSDLADKHRLTIYDAAYLELAMRTGYPLASLDRDLRAAATSEGVAVLPV